MGLFDRLWTLLRSNINDLISRAENPEKMLNQLIVDMKTQLAKAKQQVASAIADEKKLQSDAENMKKQAEDWERRAMLAVQEGRDDMAKQALGPVQRADAGRPAAARDLAQAQGGDRRAQALASPAQRQDRRSQAQEEHPGGARQAGRGAAADPGDDVRLSDKSAFESFERMAEKIEAHERRAHGGGRAQRGSLGRPAGQAVRGARVQGQLGPAAIELKSRMGLLAPPGQPADPAAQQGRAATSTTQSSWKRETKGPPTDGPDRDGCRPSFPDRPAAAGGRAGGPRRSARSTCCWSCSWPSSWPSTSTPSPTCWSTGSTCRARSASASAVAATLGALVGVVLLIAPPVAQQVQDLLTNLPRYLTSLDANINDLIRRIPLLRRAAPLEADGRRACWPRR